MRYVLIKATGTVEEVSLPADTQANQHQLLREIQRMVGGNCELVVLPTGEDMLTHATGKLEGLPQNPVATWLMDQMKPGKVVFVCVGDLLIHVKKNSKTDKLIRPGHWMVRNKKLVPYDYHEVQDIPVETHHGAWSKIGPIGWIPARRAPAGTDASIPGLALIKPTGAIMSKAEFIEATRAGRSQHDYSTVPDFLAVEGTIGKGATLRTVY